MYEATQTPLNGNRTRAAPLWLLPRAALPQTMLYIEWGEKAAALLFSCLVGVQRRVGKFIWQGVVDENTKAGTWAARRVA